MKKNSIKLGPFHVEEHFSGEPMVFDEFGNDMLDLDYAEVEDVWLYAHLFAASPDLLSACEDALNYFLNKENLKHPIVKKLRKAINKANGLGFDR